jgi:hypothetical protein
MTRVEHVRTNDGLRQVVLEIRNAGSWDTSLGALLLAEIRRRAAEMPNERGLVDDVVTAAWLVLYRHADAVLSAARPWAYLMHSAQRQAVEELRAQQLPTRPSMIRGRGRHLLPRRVTPIGSSAIELATALRHEPSGANTDHGTDGVDPTTDPGAAPTARRDTLGPTDSVAASAARSLADSVHRPAGRPRRRQSRHRRRPRPVR